MVTSQQVLQSSKIWKNIFIKTIQNLEKFEEFTVHEVWILYAHM